MTEPRHDPHVARFEPDRELLAVAQHAMLDAESHSHRFIRQRWEEGFAAVRVALTAIREIYPLDREAMRPRTRSDIGEALDYIEAAYERLDAVSSDMLGTVMHAVLTGEITTVEQLDRRIVRPALDDVNDPRD